MNVVLQDSIAILLWPGLIGAALLGWFFMWMMRKLTAQLQGRKGPLFYQPFYDFIKLIGKESVISEGTNLLFVAIPWASLLSMVFAVALIPVPGNPVQSFRGDLIVLVFLLEVPAICEVLAGFTSKSPYAQVSAMREAMMSMAYNVPFLVAVIALATYYGSFNLQTLANTPFSWVKVCVAITLLLALPAKLKSNPFSIPNAEQEIIAGAHTEYSGHLLALLELSHAVELVALVGLFAVIMVPPITSGLLNVLIFLTICALVVAILTVTSAATARIKINQAFRFYWSWGALVAFVTLVVAVIL